MILLVMVESLAYKGLTLKMAFHHVHILAFLEDIDKKDLVLIPSDTSKEHVGEETVAETSFNDDSDFEVFQATDEWQTVKEGQAIPQGLHVQMNLQTGEKRAKLMDESKDTGKKETNENEKNAKHLPKQEYIKIDQNIISKQRLKEVLKDFKDKFQNEDLDNEKISEHGKIHVTWSYGI